MKYIFQLSIILGASLVGEILHYLLPFPVPASVYGLVVMFVLLMTKVVKLEQVEEVATYMMLIMPIFFIEPSVGLMTSFGVIRGKALVLCFASFLSYLVVIVITGIVAQFIIRKKRARKKAAHE